VQPCRAMARPQAHKLSETCGCHGCMSYITTYVGGMQEALKATRDSMHTCIRCATCLPFNVCCWMAAGKASLAPGVKRRVVKGARAQGRSTKPNPHINGLAGCFRCHAAVAAAADLDAAADVWEGHQEGCKASCCRLLW
jgi:hypothetical protein